MPTSTSVNAKLYSYLPGYETCCFTGQDYGKVTSSIQMLIDDELRICFPELKQFRGVEKIYANIEKFFIRYYDRMKRIKDPARVKSLADDSKSSKTMLEDIISRIMRSPDDPTACVAYWNGKSPEPSDICIRCPWYINHKFCLMIVSNYSEDVETTFLSFPVAEYKYLALAMFQMVSLLVNQCGVDIGSMSDYNTLFTDILTCSHIYELMNPSGSARQEYLDDAISMLTAPHIDYTTEEYQRYDELLSSVFRDIIRGDKVYVQDMHNAIFGSRHSLTDKFDASKDYYYSMKGTGQSGYTKEKHSLQSSAFEVDIHILDERVREFDAFIGYESHYKKPVEGTTLPDTVIRTLGINNPGKFKIRVIHIADNPLQDRCNWIHRRLMNLVQKIPSDCTKDQDKGRRFLQSLTRNWYLQYPNTEKIGIYCTDFSNATDTVDQRFTHRVLEFIFHSKEVAEFWDYVSQLTKTMVMADGSEVKYQQQTGQPQGLLASFLIFALCHHFIFLMDMKELGMEDIEPSKFYTVLGDDAVYNTVVPELEFLDDGEFIQDEAGLPRSVLEMAHFQKCAKYAGFKINYDKSVSTHYNGSEAKLDFAKVTYRNGRFFSPIPFRLAMRYSISFDDQLAVSIWRADRDDSKASRMLDLQIGRLDPSVQQKYTDLIRCGELPFLARFTDTIQRSEEYINKVRYALAVSLLNAGLAFTLLGDSKRSRSAFDQFDATMASVFTTAQQMRLENIDANHKVMHLLVENAAVLQTLHDIYQLDNLDDRFLAMCLASFMGDQKEEVLWLIYGIADFQNSLRMAKANPNINRQELAALFPAMPALQDIKKDIGIISNKFLTRGITKRPGESSYMFRKTLNLLDELSVQLDSSFSG